MTQRELNERLKNIPLVTKQNLSLLLNKEPRNLDYWTRKLVQEGVLIKLKSGHYAPRYFYDLTTQDPQAGRQYLEYLANALCTPSYISAEYVLAEIGLLAESVINVTSTTLKTTRNFATPLGTFAYRNITADLFGGTSMLQWRDKQIVKAQPGKALFDYLYQKPRMETAAWDDYLANSGRFNWDVLQSVDYELFLAYVRLARSARMNEIGQRITTLRKL